MEKSLLNLAERLPSDTPFFAFWLEEDGILFDYKTNNTNETLELLYLILQKDIIIDNICLELEPEQAEEIKKAIDHMLSTLGPIQPVLENDNSLDDQPLVKPINMSK